MALLGPIHRGRRRSLRKCLQRCELPRASSRFDRLLPGQFEESCSSVECCRWWERKESRSCSALVVANRWRHQVVVTLVSCDRSSHRLCPHGSVHRTRSVAAVARSRAGLGQPLLHCCSHRLLSPSVCTFPISSLLLVSLQLPQLLRSLAPLVLLWLLYSICNRSCRRCCLFAVLPVVMVAVVCCMLLPLSL